MWVDTSQPRPSKTGSLWGECGGPRGTDILLCILSAQELTPLLPLLSSVPLLLALSLTILGIDSRARGRTGSLDSYPEIHRLLSGVLELVCKIVYDVCIYPAFIKRVL